MSVFAVKSFFMKMILVRVREYRSTTNRVYRVGKVGMMTELFGIRFKMFPIVELTKLGGQNFKVGLYSENFWL
jgi:hypothetical protein